MLFSCIQERLAPAFIMRGKTNTTLAEGYFLLLSLSVEFDWRWFMWVTDTRERQIEWLYGVKADKQ